MITWLAIWFLVSLVVTPLFGKCIAYGMGSDEDRG